MKFRKDMVRNDSSHYLPFPFAFACFRRIPSTALNILYDCKFRTESKIDSVLHICINIVSKFIELMNTDFIALTVFLIKV